MRFPQTTDEMGGTCTCTCVGCGFVSCTTSEQGEKCGWIVVGWWWMVGDFPALRLEGDVPSTYWVVVMEEMEGIEWVG
jgi:hypothetical protein